MQDSPLSISSGDLVADRRYQWALDYLARGDQAGAAEILEQVLERAPAFAGAWFRLGAIREAAGDRERAVAAFTAARDFRPCTISAAAPGSPAPRSGRTSTALPVSISPPP